MGLIDFSRRTTRRYKLVFHQLPLPYLEKMEGYTSQNA
jgi:hypothetical protein